MELRDRISEPGELSLTYDLDEHYVEVCSC